MTRPAYLWTLASIVLVAGLITLSASPPAVGGQQPTKVGVDLRVAGERLRSLEVCGRRRRALETTVGQRLSVTVRAPSGSATLVVRRCSGGRWRLARRQRLRLERQRSRTVLRARAPGDLRLRLRARAAAGVVTSRPLHLAVRARTGGSPEVVDLPVAFLVSNTNGSRVPCPSDGARYTVRGHLVGPRAALVGGPSSALTVYLHDLGLGEWFWRFSAVPGYDFGRQMAEAGHTSLTIDELGYDSSDHPDGNLVCVGSHADVVHQIVTALRGGQYAVEGGPPRAFARITLAGQSTGGQIAQVEAYSYKDIDALAVLGFADQGASQQAQSEFLRSGQVCARGGERAEGDSGPSGYAYFGQTEDDFRSSFFNPENAEPAVVSAAASLRNRGPCGDFGSTPTGIAVDQANLGEITVPVLLLFGEKDSSYPPSGAPQQSESFSGSRDVTTAVIGKSGHAFTLERTAPAFRQTLSEWLSARGF